MKELLPIGAIATATDCTVSTLRYYDELGLIESAERIGGKRRFHRSTIDRVAFIRSTQAAGFTLDEIRRLLDDTELGDWRDLVDQKIVELTRRRDLLDDVLDRLARIRTCGCHSVGTCESVTMATS